MLVTRLLIAAAVEPASKASTFTDHQSEALWGQCVKELEVVVAFHHASYAVTCDNQRNLSQSLEHCTRQSNPPPRWWGPRKPEGYLISVGKCTGDAHYDKQLRCGSIIVNHLSSLHFPAYEAQQEARFAL